MVKLTQAMGALTSRTVLLLGDFMLDHYTIGKVKRISPEAPVPVLNVDEQFDRPGGAGNALLNLVSLGLKVIPIGRLGADNAGQRICESFRKEGIDCKGLFLQTAYATPVKNRLIADNQQLLRLDFEEGSTALLVEEEVLSFYKEKLSQVDLVAISDYGKGFLTPSLLRAVITLAKEKKIPVIVDPKGKDFSRYRGATIIKPNLSEAQSASRKPLTASLREIALDLLDQTEIEALFITKADKGISLFFRNEEEAHFPVADVRLVRDVTGAGDTVLAVLACCLANGLPLGEAAKLSNIAAGIAVGLVGCARVSLADIRGRLYEEDVMNKICDQKNLFLVEKVLTENSFVLFNLASAEALGREFFINLRQVSQTTHLQVFIFFQEADAETLHFLATLEEVDFLITDQLCLESLLSHFTPEKIFDYSLSV